LAKICQGGFDSLRHVVLPVKCESHNCSQCVLCYFASICTVCVIFC